MSVTTSEYKRQFLASAEATEVKLELERMVSSPLYATKTFYTPMDSEQSFVDKHMTYLSERPKLKASEYLANLRLMTKARR